jgi:hypothetical protein
MNPKVRAVTPLENYRLLVEFSNGERRTFDLSPYLTKGVFERLRDPELFKGVRVVAGSLEWPSGIDLSYDTVYLDSSPAATPSSRTAA